MESPLKVLAKNFENGHSRKVRLVLVLLGDNPQGELYVRKKIEFAQRIGVEVKLIRSTGEIPEPDEYEGLVVQLPVPRGQSAVLDRIPVAKDIDGLTSTSFNLLKQSKACFWPAVVKATFKVMGAYQLLKPESQVALVGRGWVGQHLAAVFRNKGFDKLSLIGRDLPDRLEEVRRADLVVSSVGQSGLITGEMVKKGVAVFDLGTMVVEKGRGAGDVDFESVAPKASFITPVPGGLGPVTVACLFENLFGVR